MAADAPAAFFSYSREDLEFALRLAKDLKNAGANVWMDKLDLRPGQLWQRKVEEALSACPRVLVILSPSSVDSHDVMAEVTFAMDERKEVIPVLYRECKVPFRLRPFQYVDFRTDYSQGLEELLATVALERLQEAAPTSPLPLGEAQPAASDAPERKRAPGEAAKPARAKRYRAIRKTAVGREHVAVPRFDDQAKRWKLRELRTLTGHAGQVYGVAVTPDGDRVVSASQDTTLTVWELASGSELRRLVGHKGPVKHVAVTPNGQHGISASWDKTLKVWDFASGSTLRTLTGHEDPVMGVTVTPDGQRAVSASGDKTLKLWELESGRHLLTIFHAGIVNAVAITPGGGQRAVSASDDGKLRLWDLGRERELEIERELRTLTGHKGRIMDVAVTPDGQRAVSASDDTTLRVWDLASGGELHTLRGHRNWVMGVAVTPDGLCAVSASYDKTLKVWDLVSGRDLATFKADDRLHCCAVCPDGKTILAGDGGGAIHCLCLE